MTRQDVINNIMASYKDCGVTLYQVEALVKSGELEGFSYRTIYTGLRMALGMEHGRNEKFTIGEVSEALGITEEEAMQEIERLGIETVQTVGEPVSRFVLPPTKYLS